MNNEGKVARWKLVEERGRVRVSSHGVPYVVCSLCGGSLHEATAEEKGLRKYCYECGARMDTSDKAPGQYED